MIGLVTLHALEKIHAHGKSRYIDPIHPLQRVWVYSKYTYFHKPAIRQYILLMEKVGAFDSWVPLWESTGWPSKPVHNSSTSWPFSQWEFQDAQLLRASLGFLWGFFKDPSLKHQGSWRRVSRPHASWRRPRRRTAWVSEATRMVRLGNGDRIAQKWESKQPKLTCVYVSLMFVRSVGNYNHNL